MAGNPAKSVAFKTSSGRRRPTKTSCGTHRPDKTTCARASSQNRPWSLAIAAFRPEPEFEVGGVCKDAAAAKASGAPEHHDRFRLYGIRDRRRVDRLEPLG